MSRFHAHLQCAMWDLLDEGIDNALDHIHGESAATGITVPMQCPPVDVYRPHPGVAPRRFRSAGGAQFQPNAACYPTTRLRPLPADWLKKANPLTQLAEACAKRDLGLRLRLDANHSPAAVARYRDHAVKDVFGNGDPEWLCPINLDVREYHRAVVEDLSQYEGIDAIELINLGYAPGADDDDVPGTGFQMGCTGRWLRQLCFCESCRQWARRDGLPIDRTVRAVEELLSGVLATGEPLNTPMSRLLDDQPVLAAFVAWRSAQITALVDMIRSTCRVGLVVVDGGPCVWSGLDLNAAVGHVDAVQMPTATEQASRLPEQLERARADLPENVAVELALSACTPPCPDAAHLVASMKQAANARITHVHVAEYGGIPLARLEWIQQAVRYARREAEDAL